MTKLKRVHSRINRKFLAAFVLVILVCQLFSGIVHAQKRTIFLVGTNDTKNSFSGNWLEMIYTEAYRRLGFNICYEGYPARRASYLSDNGYVDGEITRVASYSQKHPNMIKVDEPHFTAIFAAYTIDPTIKLDGWNSLKGTNYEVNYRLGVTKLETMLPLLLPKDQLDSVHTIKSGLFKIAMKRGDIFIGLGSHIEETIVSNENLRNSGLRKAGTMGKVMAHSFLHKKNKSIAVRLSKVLAQMKAEGLVEKYRKLAFKIEN